MIKILYSTGSFKSKSFSDVESIKNITSKIKADGFELMILKDWNVNDIGFFKELNNLNISFPIGHLSKSSIVKCYESGDREQTKAGHNRLIGECKIFNSLGIDKAVMHLWGWPDNNFENILSTLKEAVSISTEYGVELLIETLPTRNDTLINRLEQVVNVYPKCRFTADVRLLRYCNMQDAIFNVDWLWKENRIAHIHVSDCTLNENQQVNITALQPGTGIIDFDAFISGLMKKKYTDAITIEFCEYDSETGEVNIDLLNNSVEFIKGKIEFFSH